MITYVAGSLFSSPAQVLVNTVNTQGVMGKGVAAEFKRIYPEMFAQYRTLCEVNKIDIGILWIYKTPHKWVLNFPTKKHWRNPSKQEYIEAGLRKFYDKYAQSGIHSIAFPALGCGNGGLDWENIVKPVMEKYLKKLPIDVFIHLPWINSDLPEHENQQVITEWLRSEPASLPFTEVWEDLQSILSGKCSFITFANKSPFSAKLSEDDGGGIIIETENRKSTVSKELIQNVWQQLRYYGYTRRSIAPNGRERDMSYLVPILAELPYVKPVELSETDDFNLRASIGLRYFAPASSRLPLFSAA